MIRKLAAGALAGMLIFTSACGGQTEEAAPTVPSQTTASPITETEAPEETTEAREYPDLPEADYGGFEFRVLSKDGSATYWTNRDIFAAEQNGEPINDAVFLRNQTVGERYGVNITEDAGNSDPAAAARKTTLAGDDVYSMYAFSMPSYAALATKGMLLDWHTLPNVDLSRPWYDQNSVESCSIGKKLYFAVGDILIMDKDATWSTLFNKRLAADLGLPNLYELTINGGWTIDAMNTAMTDVAYDLDGDGKMGANDKWGLLGEAWNTNAFIAGAGVRVFSKDENDLPYISMNTERYYQVFELASKINGDKSVTMLADNMSGFSDVWEECIRKAFREDRALFYVCSVFISAFLRMMESDFGIIPIPKYTESQERYYDIISLGAGDAMAVPITVGDQERVGTIIEALSAESRYTLIPAYYDVTLYTKLARDEESTQMLDIIYSSRVYELGLLFGWGNLFYLPGDMTGKNSEAFASSVEKKIKSAEKAMQKDIDLFAAL